MQVREREREALKEKHAPTSAVLKIKQSLVASKPLDLSTRGTALDRVTVQSVRRSKKSHIVAYSSSSDRSVGKWRRHTLRHHLRFLFKHIHRLLFVCLLKYTEARSICLCRRSEAKDCTSASTIPSHTHTQADCTATRSSGVQRTDQLSLQLIIGPLV